MNLTQPIRDQQSLELFKSYYKDVNENPRNYTLIVMGLNTALRIHDVLRITWGDIYDFERNCLLDHLEVIEHKTGKRNRIAINVFLREVLQSYFLFMNEQIPLQRKSFLFLSRNGENQPISRSQAYRIVKKVAIFHGMEENISCHSLRKTFGYHAWKQGVAPAVLMNIFNHSSYQVTKRYLGIDQDDKDEVFLKNIL